MKSILLIATLLVTSSLFADTRIDDNVKKICEIVNCEGFQAQSDDIKGMIAEYVVDYSEEEINEYYEYVINPDFLPAPDESYWGRLSMEQALQFVRLHASEDYQRITTEQANTINQAIINMVGTGVEFGFTADTGGSVCGATFPGLLIINPKNKTVDDIKLFGWPSC